MSRERPREPIVVGDFVPDPAMTVDRWEGCYSSGWPKELLVPEAFAHPAKFSYLLIERIYDHARAEGWLPPGTRVLDPFAGVALGAIHALRLGCSWTGVELEPKFFDIGRTNLAKWMHEYRHLPGWGPWAMVVNGDSRKLCEALGHAPTHPVCAISSPPYGATSVVHCEDNVGAAEGGRKASALTDVNGNIKERGYGHTPGNLADMAVSSPPWTNQEPSHAQRSSPSSDRLRAEPPATRGQRFLDATYGSSPGQLANMPADLAVSSPPYVDSVNAKDNGIDWSRMDGGTRDRTIEANYRTHGGSGITAQHYGTTEGQLGAMAPGMVVSSPPYASTDTKPHALGTGKGTRATGASADRNKGDYHYGTSEGQLGAMPECVISSPPYGDQQVGTGADGRTGWRGYTDHGGGTSAIDGQMAAMSTGELCVSSPPYADGCGQQGHDYHPERMVGTRTGYLQRDSAGYGTSTGQMADMVASSPPWIEEAPSKKPSPSREKLEAGARPGGMDATYGTTPGQLGSTGDLSCNPTCALCGGRKRGMKQCQCPVPDWKFRGEEPGTTFWEAARAVVSQTYQLLRPGAHAIWVVKSYVRDKAIVDFPGQWRAMCESVGFVTLHEHHAMLVEEHGEQGMLFGTASDADTAIKEGRASVGSTGKMFLGKAITTERKSFFRRLAEKKGSPRIDFEVVLCMFKPSGDSNGVDLCTSSPPYSVGLGKEHTYADHTKRDRDSHRRIMTEKRIADPFYGTTEGNLGNLPDDASTKSRKRPRKPRVVQESAPAQDHRHD